jgi:hypothetical protein
MGSNEGAILFLGDLSDSWVVAIADVLPAPASLQRVDCSGNLPDRPFDSRRPPRLIVVHRHHWNASDAKRIKCWRDPRASVSAPVLTLCFSPYLRYEELERVSGLFDLIVPEATATDVLPGRVARLFDGKAFSDPRAEGPSFRIEMSCGTDELGEVLVQRCAEAGYRVEMVEDSSIGEDLRIRVSPVSTTERVLTIWEVPVLEPGWPERLDRRVLATGPVIALMGFADRSTVTLAKAKGACACLELPCDSDDLLDVIERVTRSIPLEEWALPPRAEPPHHLPPRPRRRVSAPTRSSFVEPSLWSDHRPPSTIA